MESPFAYNTISTDLNFLSRKKELTQFMTIIKEGRNVILFEPPRTGKHSFVTQGFKALKNHALSFRVCEVDFTGLLYQASFYNRLLAAMQTSYPDFGTGEAVADGYAEVPVESWESLFAAAAAVHDRDGVRTIFYFREFQHIQHMEGGDRILNLLEKVASETGRISFIFSGSSVNAMKQIFDQKKSFCRSADRIVLSRLEEKAVSDRIIKTFLRVGRVVEPEQAERVYLLVDGHPWYIWQIAQISFNLTKGYLNDSIIDDAIASVLSLHEVRFREIIGNLSLYQLNYLRAIFDGRARTNSAETILQYHLNSSANVHRVKEALAKKEVISFDESGAPYIIDPLFLLWLERIYFRTPRGI